MELVASVSIPNPPSAVCHRPLWELLRLREVGLIQDKLYVYLAIKLTYTQSNPSIDILSFCEQWELTEMQLALLNCPTAQERGAATSSTAAAIGIVLSQA